jgi:hypothetical protein
MSVAGIKIPSRLLAAVAVASLIAAPVVVYADASNVPMHKVHKAKKKAVKHRKARARPMARAPKPMAPVEQVAQAAPEPVYTPPPPPEPLPPLPEPAPAPAPAAPVAAAKGGNGALLGILAAAAVAGGIALAASGGSNSP